MYQRLSNKRKATSARQEVKPKAVATAGTAVSIDVPDEASLHRRVDAAEAVRKEKEEYAMFKKFAKKTGGQFAAAVEQLAQDSDVANGTDDASVVEAEGETEEVPVIVDNDSDSNYDAPSDEDEEEDEEADEGLEPEVDEDAEDEDAAETEEAHEKDGDEASQAAEEVDVDSESPVFVTRQAVDEEYAQASGALKAQEQAEEKKLIAEMDEELLAEKERIMYPETQDEPPEEKMSGQKLESAADFEDAVVRTKFNSKLFETKAESEVAEEEPLESESETEMKQTRIHKGKLVDSKKKPIKTKSTSASPVPPTKKAKKLSPVTQKAVAVVPVAAAEKEVNGVDTETKTVDEFQRTVVPGPDYKYPRPADEIPPTHEFYSFKKNRQHDDTDLEKGFKKLTMLKMFSMAHNGRMVPAFKKSGCVYVRMHKGIHVPLKASSRKFLLALQPCHWHIFQLDDPEKEDNTHPLYVFVLSDVDKCYYSLTLEQARQAERAIWRSTQDSPPPLEGFKSSIPCDKVMEYFGCNFIHTGPIHKGPGYFRPFINWAVFQSWARRHKSAQANNTGASGNSRKVSRSPAPRGKAVPTSRKPCKPVKSVAIDDDDDDSDAEEVKVAIKKRKRKIAAQYLDLDAEDEDGDEEEDEDEYEGPGNFHPSICGEGKFIVDDLPPRRKRLKAPRVRHEEAEEAPSDEDEEEPEDAEEPLGSNLNTFSSEIMQEWLGKPANSAQWLEKQKRLDNLIDVFCHKIKTKKHYLAAFKAEEARAERLAVSQLCSSVHGTQYLLQLKSDIQKGYEDAFVREEQLRRRRAKRDAETQPPAVLEKNVEDLFALD